MAKVTINRFNYETNFQEVELGDFIINFDSNEIKEPYLIQFVDLCEGKFSANVVISTNNPKLMESSFKLRTKEYIDSCNLKYAHECYDSFKPLHDRLWKICKERNEADFLFTLTKIVAESDSIGEGYGYCGEYNMKDYYNNYGEEITCNGYLDDYLINAGFPLYEQYLKQLNITY